MTPAYANRGAFPVRRSSGARVDPGEDETQHFVAIEIVEQLVVSAFEQAERLVVGPNRVEETPAAIRIRVGVRGSVEKEHRSLPSRDLLPQFVQHDAATRARTCATPVSRSAAVSWSCSSIRVIPLRFANRTMTRGAIVLSTRIARLPSYYGHDHGHPVPVRSGNESHEGVGIQGHLSQSDG